MRMTRSRTLVAVLAVMALALAACGGGGSDDSKEKSSDDKTDSSASSKGPAGTGTATVNALFVTSGSDGKSTGGTSPVTVKIGPSSDKALRVGFSEDEVAGTGDQWRASGWSAVSVATLLTGAPLNNRDVQFDLTGRIDGPSAGGLLTVAVLSILRGDPLQTDVTMTGTINPDGTIGPVGGIPYKLDGVVKDNKKRMLIPTGTRNTPDDSGQLVDVVQLGQTKGVTVTEVDDIYAAYKAFTGKDLPKLPTSTDTKLDETAYQRLKAKVTTWLAKYDASDAEFAALPADVQSFLSESFGGFIAGASDSHDQAIKLRDNGLEAGAFEKAVNAAGFANALVNAGEQYQVAVTQGIDAFRAKVQASAAVGGEIQGVVDSLKTFQPRTVSDAGALIQAYGKVIDAVSAVGFGDQVASTPAASDAEEVIYGLTASIFYEAAGTETEAARDALDVGRDLGGAELKPGVDLKAAADFFRKGGDANLVSFEALIIEPYATKVGVSDEQAKIAFATSDFDYGLAVSGRNIQEALKQYFGAEEPSAYAELGGAAMLYSRTAGLLAKYYSLGQFDDEGEISGIKNDRAFTAAVGLGQSQAASGIGALRAKQVNPTVSAGDFEVAGVMRESGDAGEKLDALTKYWDSYINARILAYLGGFAQV